MTIRTREHAAALGLAESRSLRFFVPGLPRPAGSKKAFVIKQTGRAILTDMSGSEGKHWRSSVAQVASEVLQGELLHGPLCFAMLFVFPRPASHYGSGRNAGQVRASAPPFPAVKPDTTKLVRAVEDALAKVAFKDDAQIVGQSAHKIYGQRPGVHVHIWSADRPMEEPEVIRVGRFGGKD